jgi:hypothetical protein
LALIDQVVVCGQNQQGLSDDFYFFLPALLEALDDCIRWPTAAERRVLRGSLWDFPATGLLCPIFILDGTIQEVEKPDDPSEAVLWCARKKKHGFNHQLICQWNGKIVAVHTGFHGSEHDSTCYRLMPMYMTRGQYFSDNETLIADAGYEGCGVMHVRKRVSTEVERWFNSKIRRHRVLVEFVFGAIKSKFTIVKNAWTRGGVNRATAGDVFFLCCQLFNFWMAKYGYLRGAAYRVRHELEAWEAKLLQHPRLRGGWSADDSILEMILDGNADDLYQMLEVSGVV